MRFSVLKTIVLMAAMMISANAMAQDVYSCKAEGGNPVTITVDGAVATVAMNDEKQTCEAETSAEQLKLTSEALTAQGVNANVIAGVTCKGTVADETLLYVISSTALGSEIYGNTAVISPIVGFIASADCAKQ